MGEGGRVVIRGGREGRNEGGEGRDGGERRG